jgi:hypothetical protein
MLQLLRGRSLPHLLRFLLVIIVPSVSDAELLGLKQL